MIYKTKQLGGVQADLEDSTFVKAFWPVNPFNRENAWTIAVEALAGGALPARVREVAEKWKLTDEDAKIYAARVGALIERDGNQWCAMRGDFINLQESPAGFGDTAMDALAQLALALGFKPGKPQRRGFTVLLK